MLLRSLAVPIPVPKRRESSAHIEISKARKSLKIRGIVLGAGSCLDKSHRSQPGLYPQWQPNRCRKIRVTRPGAIATFQWLNGGMLRGCGNCRSQGVALQTKKSRVRSRPHAAFACCFAAVSRPRQWLQQKCHHRQPEPNARSDQRWLGPDLRLAEPGAHWPRSAHQRCRRHCPVAPGS